MNDVHALPWATETVYIIGGGPSAARFDLSALEGIVVGVNDSAVHAPCDVAFSASPPWVRARRRFLTNFAGCVVVVSMHGERINRKCRLARPVLGVQIGDDRPRVAHNSGHEALRWVADMGARHVVLIGFDMDPAEPVNWHDGYEWMPDKASDKMFDFAAWVDAFDATAEELAERGVTIWNANPDSQIRCFPFTEIPCVS